MMTQLETAIVNAAQGLLAEEALFCLLVKDKAATDEDQRDYDRARGGLMTLLALAHQVDSGLSAAAVEALREIEAKEIAATNEASEFLSCKVAQGANSDVIISAQDLLGVSMDSPLKSTAVLLELLTDRLLHARSHGASCVVLKPEDGFVLFHADRTKKPLSEHVIGALRALSSAGYIFVKDISPGDVASLRVYFGPAPEVNRVTLEELVAWGVHEIEVTERRA